MLNCIKNIAFILVGLLGLFVVIPSVALSIALIVTGHIIEGILGLATFYCLCLLMDKYGQKEVAYED